MDHLFEFGPNRRLKRGTAHALVADALGVERNNRLCRLVQDRMKSRGVTLCTIRGALYFKFVDVK